MIIETIRPTDAAAFADLFVAAFDTDPVWTVSHPDPQRRRPIIHAWAEQLVLTTSTIDAARDDDGDLIGALWWEPPTTTPQSTDDSCRYRNPHDAAVDRHRPHEPHFYLHDLAVSPAQQGRGVGTALLVNRLDAIDQRGLDTWLEATTTNSQRLYTRHGFSPTASLHLYAGVTTTLMRRPASGRPGLCN